MKKVLFSLLILALAVACGQDKFTVNGKVSEPLPVDAYILLTDLNGQEIATAPVNDGSFKIKGDASAETMYVIQASWPGKDQRDRSWSTMFIPEKGNINVTLGPTESTVEGGTVNEAYKDFQQKISDTYKEYRQKAQSLAGAAQEEAEALYEETMKKLSDLSKETIAKNAKNYVALIAIQNISDEIDLEELDGLLAKCGKFVSENESIKRIRSCKEAEVATAEGQPFVDFAGTTPEGAAIKLSDYVGKGKWVLTDFWASWCGPCMREVPNIKKVFESFEGEDFMVLGVAVWERGGDNTASANKMKEMGMEWHQIFVGADKTPTDSYGIVGIPTMILFAPDGTIYKRGEVLRGESMYKTVAEALGK